MEPVIYSGLKGMDNIHGDIELPHDILRRLVNADVLDSGRLKRRKGSAQALSVSGAHSLWPDGVHAYFVLANQLRKFMVNGTSSVIGTFLAGLNKVSYSSVNGYVYLTCKTARARLLDGVLSTWGVELPTSPPTMTASAGSLSAGKYFACITYLLADGRESGASALSSITLAVDGGITTLSMPNPVDANVTKKRLYLSRADGDVLYMAAEVGRTDQFVSRGTEPAGAKLRTAHLSPPPMGKALDHYNGRIFIVDAAEPNVVWYTEAQDYDHVNLRKNYYQFAAPVSVIAAVKDGLYVCADQTYFIPGAGNPDARREIILEFGAIEGSASTLPNSANAIWMSIHGPVIGKDGGVVELIAEKAIAAADMTNATSMVREKDGLRQFVVVGSNGESSFLQAGSYAEAEIVRRAAT